MHAVSVGEVQVLRPLVELVEQHRPDQPIAISVTTDSGIALARKLFARHHVFRAPLDFTWAVRNTFQKLRPRLIVLCELELWPNWLLHAKRTQCPVVIVNGRLSESSLKGYARVSWLVRPCLQSLSSLGVQSPTYAQRFESLGVERHRISVTGNVKFDGASGDRQASEIRERRNQLRIGPQDCIWVAGSTQSPEERLVLDAFRELHTRHPSLRLILVPRHPERFQEVAQLIHETGIPWARRSETHSANLDTPWRIFLGDTIGELRWWWGLATLGFVGGSFGTRGGQNMIEPCAYGVATCFGPNTKNFSDIVRLLLDAKACEQLSAPKQLAPWIETMILQPELCTEMGLRATRTCELHRGASQRTWELLEPFLAASTPTSP
jgi:3-deoxy-D-manno-octulosonic-acid transferase